MAQNRENPLPLAGSLLPLSTAANPACACRERKADLSFEIPAEVSAIDAVVEAVTAFAEAKLADEDKPMEVQLALQELLANAVVHGCDCDPNLKVQCWAAYDAQAGLLVVVSDPGPGFLPHSVPDPLRAENIGREFGRGVLLIRSLMSDVHYLRNGSEVHLLKR